MHWACSRFTYLNTGPWSCVTKSVGKKRREPSLDRFDHRLGRIVMNRLSIVFRNLRKALYVADSRTPLTDADRLVTMPEKSGYHAYGVLLSVSRALSSG
jgi:hypothetical protein